VSASAAGDVQEMLCSCASAETFISYRLLTVFKSHRSAIFCYLLATDTCRGRYDCSRVQNLRFFSYRLVTNINPSPGSLVIAHYVATYTNCGTNNSAAATAVDKTN